MQADKIEITITENGREFRMHKVSVADALKAGRAMLKEMMKVLDGMAGHEIAISDADTPEDVA